MVLVWREVRLVFLLFCSLWHTAAAECLPDPLDIRLGNITLPDYDNKVARGLDIKLGTPPQQFAFLPQSPLNISFVFWNGNASCPSGFSPTACGVLRGGLYDNTTSSSIDTPATNSYPTDNGTPPMQWVTDEMDLGFNASLTDFPFGIAQYDDPVQRNYHPQSALGVGSNSSVLSWLKENRRIASRTWSMFWGLQGATENVQMDGSFVLGGYDKAKTQGQEFKKQITSPSGDCRSGMELSISGMQLNFPNGTNQSIFDSSQYSSLRTCIDPDHPILMTIPSDTYENYEKYTGDYTNRYADGINYHGMLYPGNTKNLYDGDLTVTLQNGPSFRFRNDQLIVPHRTVDNQSGNLRANGSNPELLLNSLVLVNKGDTLILGRHFFSSAYLMVNHDINEYTMWVANQTIEKNVVILDEDGNEHIDPCSSSTPSGGSGGSGGSTSISSGGIVGAVIGSVAGAAFIVVAALFFIWRRRKVTEVKAEAGTVWSPASGKGFIDNTPRMPQELAGDNHSPSHELPADTERKELSGGQDAQRPHELPSGPVRLELE